MDLGGGPSGVATTCSRQAALRVALAVGLVLLGGTTTAGGGCGLEVLLLVNLVRVSPSGSLSSTGLVEGGGCSLSSNMVWVLVVYLGPGETLGRLARPSGGDAFGRRSSSLEAWLRSPVYTPTYLLGESPKSCGLGDVDVLHAVSLLEVSPGERGAR
jgi:hypothetical protein